MRGSITVFLSITLTVILALVCTLIESARISAIDARINGITYMGLDSTFAEYASPLFSDYGLLLLWSKEEDFRQRLENYCSYNLDMNKGIIIERNTDLYKINLDYIETHDIEYATDRNGKVFSEQVGEYMKYGVFEGIFENLITQIDLFNQGSRIKKFYDKIGELKDVFIKVEKELGDIKDSIEKIQSVKDSPRVLLDRMLNIADDIQENVKSGEDSSLLINDFKANYKILNENEDELTNCIRKIKENSEKYLNSTIVVRESVSKLKDELLNTEDVNDEEIGDLLRDLDFNGGDSYNILKNKEIIDTYVLKLKSLDNYLKKNNGDISEDRITNHLKDIKEIKESFADFDVNKLDITFEKNEDEEGENESILDFVKKLKDEGVLALVLKNPDDLSNETIETNDLPSLKFSNVDNQDSEDDLLKTGKDKLIYSEYLINHFGNYVNQIEETKLRYELEYLINEGNNDKENLSSVVDKLILIREGCNLMYLLKDPIKRSEALKLATTLVGAMGIPFLIPITQFLILSAWAYGESIIDVRDLLSGGKVEIFKNSSSWNLSLSGIKEIAGKGEGNKSKEGPGLTYKEYLRILLLMKDSDKQYYKTMDLIQLNICIRENPDFRIEDCINKVEVKSAYSAKPLFVTIPFVKSFFNYKSGVYNFEIIQGYEY